MQFNPIFNSKLVKSDRICDNHYDCQGHEDEGDMTACLPFGDNTANGCCNTYVHDLIEYVHQGRVKR